MKQVWFRLRGVNPAAVVTTFASGHAARVDAMRAEVRELLPKREHFDVTACEQGRSAWTIWRELRERFRGRRIGMAAVLFDGSPEHRPLRLAAFLLAPLRVLAYNARGERHHLHPRSPIASWLFWRGVPLDRIWIRPWFWPIGSDRSYEIGEVRVIEGRARSPLRAEASVLTPFFPYPLSHGGAVRMFNLLREAALDYDITLFSFVERETEADFSELQKFCARLVLAPKPRYREPRWATLRPPEVGEYRSGEMRRALRRHRTKLLQVEYTQLAQYGGEILVEHDVTFDLYGQIWRREQTLAAWWDWWRWYVHEKIALVRKAAVVVMSEKDAVQVNHPRAAVIANGVDLERFRPSQEHPGARLLFIGSFRHFPNRVALRFLLEGVWPRIAEEFPEAELTVVAGPDAAMHWEDRELPRAERMRLLEYVADVRPLYEETNVVFVPTLVSAGTNIKVLEAMAMERAVVSTSSGCAGLGLTHGESVWIADGAGAFAEGTARLLRDPLLRRELAEEARFLAVERFSWRALGGRQRALWAEFARPPLRVRPAEDRDLPAIGAIQAASPEAAQWTPGEYLRYEAVVAEFEGEARGFAVRRETAPGEHELLNLAVAPEWRGRGVGRRLLEECVSRSAGEMFLEVRESNSRAIALYESYGFRRTGVRPAYYENPVEAGIVMRLRTC
ncbi:MAG: GNAT family N-acetyltransferase [Bryobacteraceae bacterium]